MHYTHKIPGDHEDQFLWLSSNTPEPSLPGQAAHKCVQEPAKINK